MAYDPNNPPSLLANSIGGGRGLRHFGWKSEATIAEVLTEGYVRGARKLGMRPGDAVRFVDNEDNPHYLVVSAVDPDTGWGTLAFPKLAPQAAEQFTSLIDEQVEHAQEWAENPEDDPVSMEAGGDGVSTFSALHHAKKAATAATSAGESATAAENVVAGAIDAAVAAALAAVGSSADADNNAMDVYFLGTM